MLTISRDPVPAMRAKLTARFHAIDQNRRNAGAAAEIAHDLRHPVEIDAGENDRIRICIDGGDRIGRHHDRVVGKLGEQKVAEDNLAALARLHEIGPVTEIDTDKDVVCRALNASVAANNQQRANPRQIDWQAGAQDVATTTYANRGADIGRRFQHCLDRGDHFALCISAMLREFQEFLGG